MSKKIILLAGPTASGKSKLAIHLAKKMNGEIINICRTNPIITNDLLKYVLKIYKNKKILIEKIGFVKGEMLKTHGSNQKLRNFFGKINFTDIKKGLNETINT